MEENPDTTKSVEVVEEKAVVKRPKRKPGRPVFERPPFANEIFTEETKRIFDNLPGKYRHFVRQLVTTGNPQMAAKLSGINGLEKVEDKQADVNETLKQHGLGPEQLIGYLMECVKAEVVMRDKLGNIYNAVDLKTRLSAIEFIFRLNGSLSPKAQKPKESLLDMFAGVDLGDGEKSEE